MLKDVGRRIVVSCLYEYLDVSEDFLKLIRDFITWGIIASDPLEVARVFKEGGTLT